MNGRKSQQKRKKGVHYIHLSSFTFFGPIYLHDHLLREEKYSAMIPTVVEQALRGKGLNKLPAGWTRFEFGGVLIPIPTVLCTESEYIYGFLENKPDDYLLHKGVS